MPSRRINVLKENLQNSSAIAWTEAWSAMKLKLSEGLVIKISILPILKSGETGLQFQWMLLESVAFSIFRF